MLLSSDLLSAQSINTYSCNLLIWLEYFPLEEAGTAARWEASQMLSVHFSYGKHKHRSTSLKPYTCSYKAASNKIISSFSFSTLGFKMFKAELREVCTLCTVMFKGVDEEALMVTLLLTLAGSLHLYNWSTDASSLWRPTSGRSLMSSCPMQGQ